ncbi:MAG: NADH-quinone oxidoreductase subunit [Chloroflexota bacterium]|jgi:proton-translocating NADH-quinone oxidoreductase chain N|nr:NADH-quinone oxidoreductase subunit [Chloroflexota bacterium]
MTVNSLRFFLPEIIMVVTGLVVVLGGLVLERDRGMARDGERARMFSGLVGLVGCAAALGALYWLIIQSRSPVDPMSGTFIMDYFAIYMKGILVLFAMVTILVGYRFSDRFRPHQSEFIGLVLLATVGGMFMASAREMIELYVALETLSISLYVMVAFNKRERLSSEAGFKYLIVGAASSAVLLYGLAILYGLTGRTDLVAVAQVISQGSNSPALMLAMVLVIGGLSFKIGAVPFHQWVPDVYQGAPTPVTAFVSVSSKAAGWGLLLRVLTTGLLPMSHQWQIYLAVVAAITMTLGNVTALSQTSAKRLLGYSSIAHAGYILMGVVAMGNPDTAALGLGAILFYLLVYGLTNLATFAGIQAVEDGVGSDDIEAMAGLSRRSGGIAMTLSISLLSLTGIPPLIGFFAKFFVFLAAVQAGFAWLALVAVINSAVSAVYYLRIVRSLYQDEAAAGKPLRVGPALWTALGVGMTSILPLAIFANVFVERAQKAAQAIFLR